jgi:hypothetical protein
VVDAPLGERALWAARSIHAVMQVAERLPEHESDLFGGSIISAISPPSVPPSSRHIVTTPPPEGAPVKAVAPPRRARVRSNLQLRRRLRVAAVERGGA